MTEYAQGVSVAMGIPWREAEGALVAAILCQPFPEMGLDEEEIATVLARVATR